jgi:hypothetical protein
MKVGNRGLKINSEFTFLLLLLLLLLLRVLLGLWLLVQDINNKEFNLIALLLLYSPFVEPWTPFQFLNHIHSRQNSLEGGSAHRKASTYTQNNTNTE